MDFSRLLILLCSSSILLLCSIQGTSSSLPSPKSDVFREYVGAEFNSVKFSDVPIRSDVEFHFILSFAIDYDTSSSPSPTDGDFNVFWDTGNLTPESVRDIKSRHPNVKVAMSLGGDSIGNGQSVYFQPSSVDEWVSNAVSSLTGIIQRYDLDGIDIDYEHFHASPEIFSQCIGKLISTLKQNGMISFASIAPYDDDVIQSHYQALWQNHGQDIDYVNFQFYAYDSSTSVDQFVQYFETQKSNYGGGRILASFSTGGDGGLTPENGFFTACSRLKSRGELGGIFVWSADDSKKQGFRYEKQSQALIAIPH